MTPWMAFIQLNNYVTYTSNIRHYNSKPWKHNGKQEIRSLLSEFAVHLGRPPGKQGMLRKGTRLRTGNRVQTAVKGAWRHGCRGWAEDGGSTEPGFWRERMVEYKTAPGQENCSHGHSTCKWPGIYVTSCLFCQKRDYGGILDLLSKAACVKRQVTGLSWWSSG